MYSLGWILIFWKVLYGNPGLEFVTENLCLKALRGTVKRDWLLPSIYLMWNLGITRKQESFSHLNEKRKKLIHGKHHIMISYWYFLAMLKLHISFLVRVEKFVKTTACFCVKSDKNCGWRDKYQEKGILKRNDYCSCDSYIKTSAFCILVLQKDIQFTK